MKSKQLTILSTALLIVCLWAVVSVTAQNHTTVGGFFFSQDLLSSQYNLFDNIGLYSARSRDRDLGGRSAFVFTSLLLYLGDRIPLALLLN